MTLEHPATIGMNICSNLLTLSYRNMDLIKRKLDKLLHHIIVRPIHPQIFIVS
jgi:hypothetical protein